MLHAKRISVRRKEQQRNRIEKEGERSEGAESKKKEGRKDKKITFHSGAWTTHSTEGKRRQKQSRSKRRAGKEENRKGRARPVEERPTESQGKKGAYCKVLPLMYCDAGKDDRHKGGVGRYVRLLRGRNAGKEGMGRGRTGDESTGREGASL
jgi:hypothetical protein